MSAGEMDAIGRRARDSVPYLFPEHTSEVDRLDVQHYAIRAEIQGNYLAPLDRPQRILDVGSGTGQWAFELCEEFPDAVVVGFDLVASKANAPANYCLVRGNLLQGDGLPFADDSFDFVHQRFLVAGIPLQSWPEAVRRLVAVTRPGGWIELVESSYEVNPGGPATRRLFDLIGAAASLRGLDGTGEVGRRLPDYLAAAGAGAVQAGTLTVPIGEWAGRAGSLGAADFRAAASRLTDVVESELGVDRDEYWELIATALQECEQHRSRYVIPYAYGRKPPC